jgi:hypothetical protein
MNDVSELLMDLVIYFVWCLGSILGNGTPISILRRASRLLVLPEDLVASTRIAQPTRRLAQLPV